MTKSQNEREERTNLRKEPSKNSVRDFKTRGNKISISLVSLQRNATYVHVHDTILSIYQIETRGNGYTMLFINHTTSV